MLDIDDSGDAADTLRFSRSDFDFEGVIDPDATSIYDLNGFDAAVTARYAGHSRPVSARRRRQIRDTRENVLRLREALAAGWNIAPELAHEEQQLAALEAR